MSSDRRPDRSAATPLRCSVCGEEPGWSFPREGDPCWNDDGGKLVRMIPGSNFRSLEEIEADLDGQSAAKVLLAAILVLLAAEIIANTVWWGW